ncbi:MAG TPA: DMT family transporter [Acidimicrobiales bacterium]|nr:DMT family transporter [Acidimicrobiales bacterium]
MTAASLTLILAAAIAHATWNLYAKRAGEAAGPAFLWLFAVGSVILYLPAVMGFVAWTRPSLDLRMPLLVLGSGALHLGYFTLLQRGYGQGDLSLVYPLARGTGPLLSSFGAVVLLDERPGIHGWIGICLASAGVLVLAAARRPAERAGTRVAAAYGVGAGVLIAFYTLWDRQAVAAVGVPPLLMTWSTDLTRAALLGRRATADWATVRDTWRSYRREVLGVAILSPLAYLLVLSALAVSPVSAVAPAREVSVVLGVLLGSRLLAERDLAPRLASATAIALGIVMVSIS